MKRVWKQFRYRLEYIGCRLLAGLIPRLPRRGCLLLASGLGRLYYRFDRKARGVARENLRLTFGDTLDEGTDARVAKASFLNFARAMLDLFWAQNLTPANFRDYLRLEGFHHADAVKAEHGSIIFLAMHYGAQEWAHLTGGFTGFDLSFVALDFKNPALEAVFRTAREHSGNHIIGQQQSMLKLLRAGRRGGGGGRAAGGFAAAPTPSRRAHRRARHEDVRDGAARRAARALGRPDRARHEHPSPGRHLHRDRASSPRLSARNESSEDHPAVLGLFRAVCALAARPMAVELPALALQAQRGDARVSRLFAVVEKFDEAVAVANDSAHRAAQQV